MEHKIVQVKLQTLKVFNYIWSTSKIKSTYIVLLKMEMLTKICTQGEMVCAICRKYSFNQKALIEINKNQTNGENFKKIKDLENRVYNMKF